VRDYATMMGDVSMNVNRGLHSKTSMPARIGVEIPYRVKADQNYPINDGDLTNAAQRKSAI